MLRSHGKGRQALERPGSGYYGAGVADTEPFAIRFDQTGGPEVLKREPINIGEAGPGEVLVRHEAIGLNFIDTYVRGGLYPAPLPSGLGNEAAGVVEAVGPEAGEFAAGDRVGYFVTPPGAYSTHRIVPARILTIHCRQTGARVAIGFCSAFHAPSIPALA